MEQSELKKFLKENKQFNNICLMVGCPEFEKTCKGIITAANKCSHGYVKQEIEKAFNQRK